MPEIESEVAEVRAKEDAVFPAHDRDKQRDSTRRLSDGHMLSLQPCRQHSARGAESDCGGVIKAKVLEPRLGLCTYVRIRALVFLVILSLPRESNRLTLSSSPGHSKSKCVFFFSPWNTRPIRNCSKGLIYSVTRVLAYL